MRKLLLIFTILLSASMLRAEWLTIPDSLPTPRDQMASVMLGTTAYFIGGNESVNDVSVPTDCVLSFDMLQREWLNDAPNLLFPRIGATAVVLNENIYVFGGRGVFQHEDTFLTTIEVLAPGRNFWQIAGYLNVGRENARAIVLGDSVIAVTGGYEGEDTYSNRITVLIPDSTGLNLSISNSDIHRMAPLPLPRSSHGAVVLNGQLYIFGGFYFSPLKDCYRYYNDGWITLDNLDYRLAGMAVASLPGDSASSALISGGFMLEGLDSSVSVMNSAGEIIDFDHDLPFPRANHSMLMTQIEGETHIIVAGGTFETERGNLRLMRDVLLYPPLQAVEESGSVSPSGFNMTAYPNPANGDMRITVTPYTSNGEVNLKLYDVLGREISGLSADPRQGVINVSWDAMTGGRTIPAGMYFLTARQGERSKVIKLVRLP